MPSDAPSSFLPKSHDPLLVLVSVLIGVFASHVALDLARRVRSDDHRLARGWLVGGAFAMGSGIWSTHFVGMAALRVPLVIGFDRVVTITSWLAAVCVSGLTLILASVDHPRPLHRLGGALIMGAGISVMHYAGIAAMLLKPGMVWDASLVTASVLIAGLASGIALSLLWRVREIGPPREYRRWQLAAALVMGGAIAAMHYVAMAGASVPTEAVCLAWDQLSGYDIAWITGATTLVLLTVTLMTSLLDARISAQKATLTESLEHAHSQLETLAGRDPLTQLSNRLAFEDRLDGAVTRCQADNSRVGVLFIDLDGFKPINASYGHATGDAVLREVAARLRGVARSSDTVARVGADEFLMLLDSGTDRAGAARVAQRVRDALREPYDVNGHELVLSCSIGIVLYPDHGPRSKLIANADAAMNAAKRAGGSMHCFYEAYMDASSADQIDLQRDLRVAIGRNELELYYQPKIDSQSGQVTGVEALLRWHHPSRGMVSPGVFIPVAERFGMIGALGNWVIEEACRQVRAWLDAGLRLRVAINLSVHQLRQDDLDRRVREAIVRHCIDPGLLTFEITESVAMEDSQTSMRVFERLFRIGVGLSIDDFGTGYSSLSYLRRLPARQLKIDRSFVQDLGQSEDARAIVEAVVNLAHALDLKVVAEGVETRVQERTLKELGCDELQGFLFAKPMPAAHILLWAQGEGPAAIPFRDSLFETQPGALQTQPVEFPPTQPLSMRAD